MDQQCNIELNRYLHAQLMENSQPLMLVLDSRLRLSYWEGEPNTYGLSVLQLGMDMESELPFLVGTLDATPREPQILPFLKLRGSRPAHVHLVPMGAAGWGIVFIDASDTYRQRRNDKQLAHELQLLQHRQRKLTDQLQRAQVSLKQKNRELEAANTTKSRFIGNMSHEFRSPLTSALGYVSLLKSLQHLPAQAHAYLNGLEHSAQHLLMMVDNLLNQASIEAGELKLYPGPIDLLRTLTELKELVTPHACQKGLDLYITMEPPLIPDLSLDELRLRQVLINLTDNAIKFTREGEIRIEVEWQEDELQVSVIDTGPGISTADRQRIFTAFERAAREGDGQTKGTGLGLSISQGLVRLMGGQLRLASTADTGSCFSFRIPAPVVERRSATPAAPLSEHSILVAEDDPDIRFLIGFYLETSGYQVHFCEDGKQVLEQADELRPDLVILDMNMPVMDGFSAARELRRQGLKVPMVALTAMLSVESREQAIAAGCDYYLQKPIDGQRLKETVGNILAGGL